MALAEEGIIAFLYKNQDYLGYVLQKITPDSFVTDGNREIFGIMLQKLQNNNGISLMDFNPELSGEKIARFSGILARQSEMQMSREALDDYMKTLLDYQYKKAMNHAGDLSEEELLQVVDKLREKKKQP